MHLSDSEIKDAKPREKPYALSGGHGMFLLVNPNGSKWWRLRYTFEGKRNLLSLGSYPEVSLNDARAEAERLLRLAKEGVGPAARRKEDRAREQAERETGREQARGPRVTVFPDGTIEIWRGNRAVRLSTDEARQVLNILSRLLTQR